ncbi:MAG: hypothetical protein EOP32_04720 [Rhodococcus sp. (in: high G+C Gram-positive bacteria)]|nr:MAG: hypothetical protein EOP32_04720 [Rhodococcus sp. (in: high G+C Gram-positive bacteria)]
MTVFIRGRHAEPTFTASGAAGSMYPHLLDADNLRDAAVTSSRLDRDRSGRSPLPLLHIDTATGGRLGSDLPMDRRAIPFPGSPRLLGGLIADAVRVGVASGAVITVDGRPPLTHRLRDDVAEHLRQDGFEVAFEVPGWVLGSERFARSS